MLCARRRDPRVAIADTMVTDARRRATWLLGQGQLPSLLHHLPRQAGMVRTVNVVVADGVPVVGDATMVVRLRAVCGQGDDVAPPTLAK